MNAIRQKGIGIPHHRPDIEIVLPVFDSYMEGMTATVKVRDNRLNCPVSVLVENVTTIPISQEPLIELFSRRPRQWMGTYANLL